MRRIPMMHAGFMLVAGLAVLGLLAAGRAAAGPVAQAPAAEFVAEVAGSPYFLAVTVMAESGAETVLAYFCDAHGEVYLFCGTGAGFALDLTSEDGRARLLATRHAGGVAGTVTVAGAAHPFAAAPTRAFGGLYRLTDRSEFLADGASLGGAHLSVQLTPDKERLPGVVTRPDGTRVTFDKPAPAAHRTPVEYREHWMVMLNDGRGPGGRILSSREPGAGILDPVCAP